MKTRNTIINSFFSVFSNILAMIIGFFAQAIFINIMGVEYLGFNGLFSNLLNILNVFELGIGSAIIYNLYKPIVENNVEKVKSLINFYKIIYRYIAIIILIFGLILLPFIKFLVNTDGLLLDINLYYVYLLFLISTLCSYFMTYKRGILYANQKNYLVNIVHVLYLFLLNVSQLLIIYFTHNYYLYLFVKIVCQFLENIFILLLVENKYPFLKEKNVSKLDADTQKDIFLKVKALFFHKISSVIVLGTDNLIISKYFGVIWVGIYSNYSLIISSLITLFNQLINACVPSLGNLMVKSSKEKNFDVFTKIRFLNFYLSSFSTSCLLCLIQPFIILWVGNEYLLHITVVIILCINFYMTTMRCCYNSFKEASGIWVEDKYIPLLEALFNIVFSILFVNIFGLFGVFLGTFMSSLILWIYSYPRFVYNKIFGRSVKFYYIENLKYISLSIFIICFSYFVCNIFIIKNIVLQLIINFLFSTFIVNIIIFIFYRKTDEFNYFFKNLNKKIRRNTHV